MGLNVTLLEDSFALVAPNGDALVETFYRHLFEDYPVVRPLFENTDMKQQQSKLLASLALVVANLQNPDQLVPALEEMGQRHVGYGAVEGYYPAVGATLLKSLAEVAGDVWNDELQQAWSDAYDEVTKHMLAGALAHAV
ncbi:MAG TPA: flavohemoprotein [Planctomycetes bacterium]|nr:flavohemoprotein [Fuerstiella sp.]HIK93812.1 flavohemoprotein [Planctomycetota bacterium]